MGKERGMTNEKLEFANMLKRKIDRLDKEIHMLMEMCPPVRSANGLVKGLRGMDPEDKRRKPDMEEAMARRA